MAASPMNAPKTGLPYCFDSLPSTSAVSGICVVVCGVSTSRMAFTLGSFSAASMPKA